MGHGEDAAAYEVFADQVEFAGRARPLTRVERIA